MSATYVVDLTIIAPKESGESNESHMLVIEDEAGYLSVWEEPGSYKLLKLMNFHYRYRDREKIIKGGEAGLWRAEKMSHGTIYKKVFLKKTEGGLQIESDGRVAKIEQVWLDKSALYFLRLLLEIIESPVKILEPCL